jgi:hypothetical protein
MSKLIMSRLTISGLVMFNCMPAWLAKLAAHSLLASAVASAAVSTSAWADVHPNLTVTQRDIAMISAQIASVPRAQVALEELIYRVNQALAQPIDVPLPKDAGAGYTHEQHKAIIMLFMMRVCCFRSPKTRSIWTLLRVCC